MQVIELQQHVSVLTPRGEGVVWLVTDYGTEVEKIFTCILKNGEVWEYRNNQIRVMYNETMGRGQDAMSDLWEKKKDKTK